MRNFLLLVAAVLVLACGTVHAQFSGAGTLASPYAIGVISGSTSYSISGFAPGGAQQFYSFSIYTAAPSGGTVDITFPVGDGSVVYILALYSGSTRLLGGTLGYADSANTTYQCRVTLASQLAAGTYILQVSAGGTQGQTGSDFDINFNLGVSGGTVVLNPPVNLTPVNNATDQSPNPRLTADVYSAENSAGTVVGSEWIIRRAADGAVVLDGTYASTSNVLLVSGLSDSTRYLWQVRYLNNVGAWTPFSAETAFTTASVWPPQIAIATLNAIAARNPGRRGDIRVTRTTTSGPLAVRYNVAGTAAAGIDYVALSGSLTIPSGSLYADIPITPLATGTFAGKRSVVLTLYATTGFTTTVAKAALSIRSTLLPERLVVREGNQFLFDMSGNGGTPGKVVTLGSGTETVLCGDFNNDGADDLVLRTGNHYQINLSGTTPPLTQSIYFGNPTATAFIGDFDGDGRDDLITRQWNRFTVDTNHTGGSSPGASFTFGNVSGDELILRSDGVRTGDWDGDGRDDIFLRRGNLFMIRLSSDGSVVQFRYGAPNAPVYLADLNGDGKVEPVIRSASASTASYWADIYHNEQSSLVLRYGFNTDHAFAADLNGDGWDELVIRRGNRYLIDFGHNGGASEKTVYFGTATDKVWWMKQ